LKKNIEIQVSRTLVIVIFKVEKVIELNHRETFVVDNLENCLVQL